MKKILLVLFIFIPFVIYSQNANYYVDNTGTGDTLSTIAEVNALSLQADDTVFFKRGCTWREALNVPTSGSSGQHIVFRCYGNSGDKPIIYGSTQCITWTDQGGNVWKSATSVTNPFATAATYSEIFFVELDASVSWGTHVADTATLANEYEWTWLSNYIYVYSTTDPDDAYTKIEAPQRDNGIYVNNRQFITIDSIDIFYVKSRSIKTEYPATSTRGLYIKNCHIAYCGSRDQEQGYHLSTVRNDLRIEDCTVHDSGRRNVSIHPYTDNLYTKDILFDGNTFYNGFHSTGPAVVIDAGEENCRFQNITIRNNLIYDSPSRTSTDGYGGSTMAGVRASETATNAQAGNVAIYNNIFICSNGLTLHLENVDTAVVYNNTFYDFNKNFPKPSSLIFLQITDQSTNISVKNNAFYSSVTNDQYGICILTANQTLSNIDVDYNYFHQDDLLVNIMSLSGVSYRTSTWANMKAATGWQTHEPTLNSDPVFTDAPDDLTLAEGSPLINAGIGVGLLTDYSGNSWSASPSIGAYEYDASPPDPPGLPSVTTVAITGVSAISVTSGGSSISDGGGTVSVKGVCWSTSANPTTSNTSIYSGTGTDAYAVTLTNLPINTTVHIRAFVVNESGTSYGADLAWTTPPQGALKNGTKIIVNGTKIVVIK